MTFKQSRLLELLPPPSLIFMGLLDTLYKEMLITKIMFLFNGMLMAILASIIMTISIKEQWKIIKLLKSKKLLNTIGKIRNISIIKRYTFLPMTTIQYTVDNKIYNFKTDLIPDYLPKRKEIAIIYDDSNNSHATIDIMA